MKKDNAVRGAFTAAFPHTLPILAGFLFLGAAYGVSMNAMGFASWLPTLMSLTIFAGSMEFVAAGLMLEAFNPGRALLLTLLVNARHLFYGLSMLDKYRGVGQKKWYLIFGMCDESFSINCTAVIPEAVDRGWFMFFVTLLNHLYWVSGSTLGGLLGPLVRFDTRGLDFVMTALFVVIFLEQWGKERSHHSSLLGLGISFACLLLFGGDAFLIPAMAILLACLTLLRAPLERAVAAE